MPSSVTGRGDVVFVTQYYRPEAIGSGPFCGDVAEAFAAEGWRVRVLTSRPHYPDGAIFPPFREGTFDRQRLAGVDVDRISTLVFANGSAAHRLASEGNFLLQGLKALVVRRVRRADVVISLCPSVLSVLLGTIYRRRGGRHIALVHDIQSGLAEGLGMAGGPLPAVLRRLERHAFNGCDLIVVLSEDMRRHLQNCGVSTAIHVLPIWTDTDTIRPRAAADGPARIALYSGNFGRKQGLMQLIELADELRRRSSSLRMVLRGRGSQAGVLGDAIQARGLTNVALADLLAPEKLADGLAEGDIHLVPQDPAAADFAVPSKVYGIMAAARPFVATARPGSTLWSLQQESGGFLCVPPNDPNAFADAVLGLAADAGLRRDMGTRGLRYVEAHCSKAKTLSRLVATVKSA